MMGGGAHFSSLRRNIVLKKMLNLRWYRGLGLSRSMKSRGWRGAPTISSYIRSHTYVYKNILISAILSFYLSLNAINRRWRNKTKKL